MRNFRTVLLVTALTGSLLIAVPASAAPGLDVAITAQEIIGGGAASGPAVDAGLVCASGTTSNVVGPFHGTATLRFSVDKTFTCGDGSGTFLVRIKVALNTTTNETTAVWNVRSGTDAYVSLAGHGTLVGTPTNPGTDITDVYSGTLR